MLHVSTRSSAANRRLVAGGFALREDGKVGFELAAYDRRRALVIDPVLTYSTYFGGSGSEACSGIAGIVIRGSSFAAIRMPGGRDRCLFQHLLCGHDYVGKFPGCAGGLGYAACISDRAGRGPRRFCHQAERGRIRGCVLHRSRWRTALTPPPEWQRIPPST